MSGSNLERLCEEVSEELQKVDEWMRANRLSLNVEKTNFMLFTHSHVDRNATRFTEAKIHMRQDSLKQRFTCDKIH